MLKNYLKTALRSFQRNKSSFFINVVGLSIGLTCSLLIFLWVLDEFQVDKFHTDSNQIYQIMEYQHYANEINTTLSTPGVLPPALKEEIPEIEYSSGYTWNLNALFTKDNISFKENGIYAHNDLFYILSIDLKSGNKEQLLTKPSSIVISEELAEKYFKDQNPIGESLLFNNEYLLTVTGVFGELPKTSTFQFDFIRSYDDWLEANEWANEWGNNGPRTIAKVASGTDIDLLNEKIKDFIKGKNEGSHVELFAYPFAKRYLYGQFENGVNVGGRIDYIRLFVIVAIFVLLIACINFMNLSTAKATKRSKEVGIRKSIGASKNSLIGQFIGESLFISVFSLLIAILLVELTLPLFNELVDKSIVLDYGNPVILLILFSTVLVTGLVSGSYPAFYLSSMEAVKTLKGSLKSSGKEAFARKGLVIFQFTLSVTLIISTVLIYNQIQYTQNKNLGYKKENVINLTIEDEIHNNWDAFKNQVLAVPGVTDISRSSSTLLSRNSNTMGVSWENKNPDDRILFENVMVGYDFIETMGLELVEGRAYSRDYGIDSTKIILNEAAIKIMGLENPIGKTFTLWGDDYEIIGIVKDFNYENLRNEVEPLFLRLRPGVGWRAFVRLESSSIASSLSGIEEVYKSFNTNYPFDYQFMDEQYAALYRSEMRIGELAKYFSIFAIIISCLGLFGLSAFTAEQRAKEIGIRKVLGATVHGLVLLLSADFTKLVLIAIGISVPLSWWLMNKWLSAFAYNAGIEWWVFAIAGLTALIIAWTTVSWQSIKAALTNPVNSLKSE